MKPTIYLIMGVSGSGKTTVGEALAQRLGFPFADADAFHPLANIEKMRQGIPLTDADRAVWLEALAAAADGFAAQGQSAVFTCSALKETYRQTLCKGISGHIEWVFLNGDFATIHARMAARPGHFMPASLLQSQFEALEVPSYGLHLAINDTLDNMIKRIMNETNQPEFGLVGLGVMGKSLARNLANKGVTLSLYNRFVAGSEEQVAERFIAAYPEMSGAQGHEDIAAFVGSLAQPRKIFLMIKAGKETDEMIEQLLPHLSPDDVVIDGGNSHYEDTKRRIAYLAQHRVDFIGTGVSGGEYGALHGPSIMPGGPEKAYRLIAPYLNRIAAKDAKGKPCCAYIGQDGAGHFIKMVHNGIEYAEMQLIAETYAHLRYVGGWAPSDISALFSEWAKGELRSYLLEITAKILLKKSGETHLIDLILDKAGNKGTGNWATIAASELGMPATIITGALFARYLSTIKSQYAHLTQKMPIATPKKINTNALKQAYQLARWLNHQQGFALMQAASEQHGWRLNFKEIARIWTNGCIIRSALMEQLIPVFGKNNDLFAAANTFAQIKKGKNALKAFAMNSIKHDLPVPCHQAALEYVNVLEARFPTANIIQAQRDFFGAHTYQRTDDASGKHYHTVWEG